MTDHIYLILFEVNLHNQGIKVIMFNIYARKLLNRFKVLNIEIALLMGILKKNISKMQFLN